MDFYRKLEAGIKDARSNLQSLVSSDEEKHSHTHPGHECFDIHPDHHRDNRHGSFAPITTGGAKWHVDGASYFWAVSEALESAEESIYILDWWLSPELYLRRPPSANERYRLDNMLKAAAERGVSVKIVVYKEVQAALSLNSAHTRQHLESLHSNISVFRHPEHRPTGHDLAKDLGASFRNLTLNATGIARASTDALKAIYGTSDGMVLFWAHHEKLCVVDGRVAFMGGLDMCFGRWDTASHPIADAHPGNLDATVFPGQDYNNARIADFADVADWEQNKLDRTRSSRMGWTDVAISLDGPIVGSLVHHFVDRWNYLFAEKYSKKNPGKYAKLTTTLPGTDHHHSWRDPGALLDDVQGKLGGVQDSFSRGLSQLTGHENRRESPRPGQQNKTSIQLVRSATKWSSGLPTEHSIANAYIDAITNAEHFIYIENQFFITATSDAQRPVTNKLGAAIVSRILKAHRASLPFHVTIVIPAVPGFAGDLKSDGALGTRAIMEFQNFSINRGGHSIIETLQKEGVKDVGKYISFYNLRNYDRINVSDAMGEAERASGVGYEGARAEHDDAVGGGRQEGSGGRSQYEAYQAAASKVEDTTWDTVSPCYMADGPPLASVPWRGAPDAEMDAYVAEELYVHSKLLIADDRLVIVGSANINDRSQLGSHDSEIAVVIEDPTTVDSRMAGKPYAASRFAASLRRYIFRKHLGLIPHQPVDKPDGNWRSVEVGPNEYDWGSEADHLVRDPLSANFQQLWTETARVNTEVFSRAFHCVPNDLVRTWEDYDEFFAKHFDEGIPSGKEKEKEKGKEGKGGAGAKVPYGHVVKEEFPGGVDELKAWLGRVRGTLVEMPLGFLGDVEDIAIEGLELNALTMELYT